mmetsp:Transcript_26795/g.39740  ORF Transcript_26795/g.39740 Transcript_26795/m.39740 type:complete len:303 (-) Transcript_26795:119-1027(-)
MLDYFKRITLSSDNRRGQVYGLWWAELDILNCEYNEKGEEAPGYVCDHRDLVTQMRRTILGIKSDHMNELGTSVDYTGIRSSPKFAEYLDIVRQLKTVDERQMPTLERKAFFINVYNSLVIHALVNGLIKHDSSFFSRLRMYATASYNIGGRVYSLNDIENGILRGNRRAATYMSSIPFPEGDERLSSVIDLDPRIHFALNCGARSCPPIMVYKAEKLDETLARVTKGALSDVEVNAQAKTVTVTMIFKWYRCDFGDNDLAVIEWIRAHAPPDVAERLSTMLETPGTDPRLLFRAYDWNLND